MTVYVANDLCHGSRGDCVTFGQTALNVVFLDGFAGTSTNDTMPDPGVPASFPSKVLVDARPGTTALAAVIDRIQVSAVPEVPAAAMWAAGLFLLGPLVRRRRSGETRA